MQNLLVGVSVGFILGSAINTLSIYAGARLILYNSRNLPFAAGIGIVTSLISVVLGLIPVGGLVAALVNWKILKEAYDTSWFYSFLISFVASILSMGAIGLVETAI